MKIMKTLLLLVILSACNKSAPNASCLFSDPLILGASVSAGYGAQEGGPAAMLAHELNPQTRITNRAVGGKTSLQSTRNLDLKDGAYSVVLALDLFFWDAARSQCGDDFESQTRKLFASFKSQKLPVIVGKVPSAAQFPEGIRLVGRKPCTTVVNKLIDELCTDEMNCFVY